MANLLKTFTVLELAEDLKVSNKTIFRAIEKGQLSALKIGVQWRFTEDQVGDYLQSRTISKPKRKKLKIA